MGINIYELLPKISDSEWLSDLLLLEKQRRSLLSSELVFVGIHNVAQFWWCGMYAVLKSRQNEAGIFSTYLYDRLFYSLSLKRITKLPKKPLEILQIGDDLTFEEVQSCYFKSLRPSPKSSKRSSQASLRKQKKFMKIKSDLPNDPYTRGDIIENEIADKLPRFRWNFPHSNYILIGEIDGMTDDTIYEFKSSKRFFLQYSRPATASQADLYGYFFRKQRKKLEITITDNGENQIFEDAIDCQNAEDTIRQFKNVDEGILPRLPEKFKCSSCEVKLRCTIYPR